MVLDFLFLNLGREVGRSIGNFFALKNIFRTKTGGGLFCVVLTVWSECELQEIKSNGEI